MTLLRERLVIPFPGMDPYLEAPDIFPDFHHALAVELRAMLNASLPPPYYARLEMRPEVGIVFEGRGQRRIVPDVAVVRQPQPPHVREAPGSYAAVAEPRTAITEGIEVHLFNEPLRHPFIEIRDPSRGHRLVTLIEVVSPSNKRPGPDRQAYEAKQREVLQSDANLIELDLLRSGERLLPDPELQETVRQLGCDYLILINRSARRQSPGMDYLLYPVELRAALPCIPVPLAGDTPDLPLDLQVAVQRVYVSGPYLRLVDYTVPPDPPLNDDDGAWADALLRAAGLRAAAAG